MQEEAGARSKHGCRMNAIFSFLLLPVVLLLRAKEQEALHHPDRRRKRREEARKRDCDGGIKGYPSLSVTSFIVPCSVLPAHPSSAVTHFHTHQRHTSSPPGFTHSRPARTTLSGSLSQQPRPTAAARKPRKQRAGLSARIHTITTHVNVRALFKKLDALRLVPGPSRTQEPQLLSCLATPAEPSDQRTPTSRSDRTHRKWNSHEQYFGSDPRSDGSKTGPAGRFMTTWIHKRN